MVEEENRQTVSAPNGVSPQELRELMDRVLALQVLWTKENSPAMQERGVLVRKVGPELIRSFLNQSEEKDRGWAVEGRDGTGMKTRVPWTRIYLPERSPRATSGWYIVYLFASDGHAAYLSLNQGTTRFVNGIFAPREPEVIRDNVERALGLLGPELGARLLRSVELGTDELAEGYQRGNVVAFEYPRDAIPPRETLEADMLHMLRLLGSVYEGTENDYPRDNGSQLHLLFKWSDRLSLDTIERHQAIEAEFGSVWWAAFGNSGRTPLSTTNVEKIRTQLNGDSPTWVFLTKQNEIWRTQLEELTIDLDEVDDARLPKYKGGRSRSFSLASASSNRCL